MEKDEFVEEIKKILKINREFDFIEILDLGALYEKVWHDGYDVGIEEGHEEEGPCHDFGEPELTPVATCAHHVQQNHAKDAESAEEVECVVTLLHATIS